MNRAASVIMMESLSWSLRFFVFIINHSVKQRQAAPPKSSLWHSVKVNPANISPRLGALFPTGALAAELRDAVDTSLLLPEEAQFLGKAIPKRAQEFTAGRLCARALL